jgi:hypothetical protein
LEKLAGQMGSSSYAEYLHRIAQEKVY